MIDSGTSRARPPIARRLVLFTPLLAWLGVVGFIAMQFHPAYHPYASSVPAFLAPVFAAVAAVGTIGCLGIAGFEATTGRLDWAVGIALLVVSPILFVVALVLLVTYYGGI